ncbi:hypothetical protein H257_19180 [Aphanomyces astaci]|uniref:Uncharacterized protein n=1 Tax=Aphanomyces astaci TaxID=112090 RepID=W4FAD6_APHAT|nr:hypothetical protein H257_19180 [Aphanomyces astaci]ETV63889.1 hypothetical protein H257_19180 [Aphanomyces astaci]|eukprot:XP_009846627.1 hypothetical protein H257_19180 [Aphanomyces astaci]
MANVMLTTSMIGAMQNVMSHRGRGGSTGLTAWDTDVHALREVGLLIHEDREGPVNLIHVPSATHSVACLTTRSISCGTAETTAISERSKHIEVRHHWIRQVIVAGRPSVHHVGRADQLADALTEIPTRHSIDNFKTPRSPQSGSRNQKVDQSRRVVCSFYWHFSSSENVVSTGNGWSGAPTHRLSRVQYAPTMSLPFAAYPPEIAAVQRLGQHLGNQVQAAVHEQSARLDDAQNAVGAQTRHTYEQMVHLHHQ